MSDDEETTDSLFEDAHPVGDASIDTDGRIEIDDDIQKSSTRQNREQYPAPFSWLVETETDRIFLDWAVEMYLTDDQRSYSKRSLAKEVGISRKSVHRRVPKLVSIGVLGVDASGVYDTYYVTDTDVMRALVMLNEIILDAYPDDPTDIPNI